MLDYEFALDFISYFAGYKEKEYIVWATVLRHMNYIRHILLENETKSDISESRLDAEDSEHLQKFKVIFFIFYLNQIFIVWSLRRKSYFLSFHSLSLLNFTFLKKLKTIVI